MKENQISGVPLVDNDRIVGMVSVNDIMNALDGGYIEGKAVDYMSPSLVLLEEDMPLAFAINHFNKFPYRRYPVINKARILVGMITSKDILRALLRELEKAIKELESKIQHEPISFHQQIYKEFTLEKLDLKNAGGASFAIKKILKEGNIQLEIIRRATVAAYELEINVVLHSEGGRLIFIMDEQKITIISEDSGPGIADVSLVLQEGYSTANEWVRSLGFGAGMGIPNTRHVSDEFDIKSQIGAGTTVTAVIYHNR
jgi:anti-sigma regulatory factor (Ser/Thr protein kinase)/predicted transcriptional regulator